MLANKKSIFGGTLGKKIVEKLEDQTIYIIYQCQKHFEDFLKKFWENVDRILESIENFVLSKVHKFKDSAKDQKDEGCKMD